MTKDERMLKAREDGLTYEEIAYRFGLSNKGQAQKALKALLYEHEVGREDLSEFPSWQNTEEAILKAMEQ